MRPLDASERAVLQEAIDLVRARFREGRHQLAAVVRTPSGRTYGGVHIEATVGRASLCAEGAALGAAATAGETHVATVVAVRHPLSGEAGSEPRIVPPCGLCREILVDYAPAARVLLQIDDVIGTVPVSDLLPQKYRGTKWIPVAR